MIAIFLFYDKGLAKQGRFTSNGIKHCNLICFDGRDWFLCGTTSKGITFRSLRVTRSSRLIEHIKRTNGLIKIIAVSSKEIPNQRWFPLWIRSCNELCRYISGVDVGFTYNPTHLIKKLVKYDNKRNYEIIYRWNRNGRR